MNQILTDIVSIFKNAQSTGQLPSVDVNTNINLEKQTIIQTGLALLLVGLITVFILLWGLYIIFKKN